MSNERERLAREWAEDCQGEGKLPAYGIAAQAAAEHILATTPEPTMEGVQWDDEKHHLAGATLPHGGEVVMMWPDNYGTGHIIAKEGEWPPDQLTPNGKRYKLVEVTDQPEHPDVLKTVEDYENAPVGTIVALNGCLPYVKRGRNDWSDAFGDTCSDKGMAGPAREVLRRGWGE